LVRKPDTRAIELPIFGDCGVSFPSRVGSALLNAGKTQLLAIFQRHNSDKDFSLSFTDTAHTILSPYSDSGRTLYPAALQQGLVVL